MKKVAIIGGGPTAVYTLVSLVKSPVPLSITVFEKTAEIGSGMPYSRDMATQSMLSNIASFEIPPVMQTLEDWLRQLDRDSLRELGLCETEIDARAYYGRLVLGSFFQAQLAEAVSVARGYGHEVNLRRLTEVVDVAIEEDGITVAWTAPDTDGADTFDEIVIATGHSWTSRVVDTRTDLRLMPLWPIKDVHALAGNTVGVFGTSLSGIDATVAIAERHGEFTEGNTLEWAARKGHTPPKIAMLSRKGLLPEADYYYPFPLPELHHLTQVNVLAEIEQGQAGLLRRMFSLFAADLKQIVPDRVARIQKGALDIDAFVDAYFDSRMATDPFQYAQANLAEAREGHAAQKACPWRVSILKAHEMFEMAAPYFDASDLEVLKGKLGAVFADNYASVPHTSIKRLLALQAAGALEIIALGDDYEIEETSLGFEVSSNDTARSFDVLIDARGQTPMALSGLGFPGLVPGQTVAEMGQGAGVHLTPLSRTSGFIQCVSLPILLTRRPFVQGLESCAKLGRDAGKAILERAVQPSVAVTAHPAA